MSDPSEISRLRARIATLEGIGRETVSGVRPLGVAAIDTLLPWGGLPLGCLHEIAPRHHDDGIEDGAAPAFAAFLLGRLAAAANRPVLWITTGDPPYAPGLAGLDLPPHRLVMVRAGKGPQALWAMEEGLRCPALAGVLAELWRIEPTAARRLQLAAGTAGIPALVLNHGDAIAPAVTRWRAGAAASQPDAGGVGMWRWHLDLLRCRGLSPGEQGMVAQWVVEWDDETRGLRLAAAAGDRAVAPPRRAAAG